MDYPDGAKSCPARIWQSSLDYFLKEIKIWRNGQIVFPGWTHYMTSRNSMLEDKTNNDWMFPLSVKELQCKNPQAFFLI